MNIFDNISFDRLMKISELGDKVGALGIMGIGMLGVLMIVAIIMLATYAINTTINRLAEVKASEQDDEE